MRYKVGLGFSCTVLLKWNSFSCCILHVRRLCLIQVVFVAAAYGDAWYQSLQTAVDVLTPCCTCHGCTAGHKRHVSLRLTKYRLMKFQSGFPSWKDTLTIGKQQAGQILQKRREMVVAENVDACLQYLSGDGWQMACAFATHHISGVMIFLTK